MGDGWVLRRPCSFSIGEQSAVASVLCGVRSAPRQPPPPPRPAGPGSVLRLGLAISHFSVTPMHTLAGRAAHRGANSPQITTSEGSTSFLF